MEKKEPEQPETVQPTAPPPPYPGYPIPPKTIYGDYPVKCECTNCHQNVVTRVEKKNGFVTWASVGGICFFGAGLGCFLGCCLIPLCIDVVQTVPMFLEYKNQ